MRALRGQFRELGLDRFPRGRVLSELFALLLCGHGLLVVALLTHSMWVSGGATLLSAYCLLAGGTIGHTASHRALTGSERLDRFVHWLTYPFVLGLSGRYWVRSHVQVHHSAPNVVGYDDDCDLAPTFRLTDAEIAAAPALLRPLFRYQVVWLALCLPLNSVSTQLQGFRHLARELCSDRRRRAAGLPDILALVLHFGMRLGLPLLFSIPVPRVFTMYGAWLFAMSYGMFAVLAPGHYPHAAHSIAASERRAGSFYFRQAAATMNFRTGFLGSVLCSGLQYQIEHHIFPGYCHVHYPRMAPYVREVLERHGVPYASMGWGEALYETLRTFATPKPVIYDLSTLVTRGAPEIETDAAPDVEDVPKTAISA
jgi:fatty acid desaturase